MIQSYKSIELSWDSYSCWNTCYNIPPTAFSRVLSLIFSGLVWIDMSTQIKTCSHAVHSTHIFLNIIFWSWGSMLTQWCSSQSGPEEWKWQFGSVSRARRYIRSAVPLSSAAMCFCWMSSDCAECCSPQSSWQAPHLNSSLSSAHTGKGRVWRVSDSRLTLGKIWL